MRLITRNEIYRWYKSEWTLTPEIFIQGCFKSLSDQELAKAYKLNVLRPGYFYTL